MGSSGNGAPGFLGARGRYLELLQQVLNDLDEDGLTNLSLLRSFGITTEELKAHGEEYRSDRELALLVSDVDNFLGIVIRSMSQSGEYSRNLRKHINERISTLTEGSWQPIYQPA